MVTKLIGALVGAAIGLLLGYKTGSGGLSTPFTYAWYTNALLGAVLGFLVVTIVPFAMGMVRPIRWSQEVVRVVTTEELNDFLTKAGDQPVLVDFYASWCPPCRATAPNLDALAREGHRIAAVDIDAAPKLAEQYRVKVVPTLHVFKNRVSVRAESGYHSLDALRALIKP